MTTMTLTPTRRTTWPVGLALGSVPGAALLVAGAWNVLIQEHVTVSSPPGFDAGVTQEQNMTAYWTWYAGTVGQERAVTILGIDEANSAEGEVSWISPIARALLKARAGDVVKLATPGGVHEIELLSVEYPAPA